LMGITVDCCGLKGRKLLEVSEVFGCLTWNFN
jgi:hypothetical protein